MNSTSPESEWVITGHGYRAAISSIGATLRQLTYGTTDSPRDLIVSYPAGTIRPLYRGALIAPWPNRIADGHYTFAGREYQVPVNEVERRHALHGLVQWVRWTPVAVGETSLTLEHFLVPQDGYPFALHMSVQFTLSDRGLETTLTTTNLGDEAAPYGCCPHPYLTAGSGTLDQWTLQAPAATRLEVNERLIPTGAAPVESVDSDFRQGRVIGTQQIDHAFTDLRADDGRYIVRLLSPGVDGVEMSWGDWGQWLQIHTADRPEPEYDRAGLAVEPMSCPPDAFNNAAGVPVIEPGAIHQAEWTIRALTGQ